MGVLARNIGTLVIPDALGPEAPAVETFENGTNHILIHLLIVSPIFKGVPSSTLLLFKYIPVSTAALFLKMPPSIVDIRQTWALLIGVDFYIPPLPGYGTPFSNLNGCVNDVEIVQSYLLNVRGISATNITALTASAPPLSAPLQEPIGPAASWPTYLNITSAFNKLSTQAFPGDLVYIHYSGHGSRYPTLYPTLKGAGGKDEVLCPTDIKSGGYPLRDVHIAYLLDLLVRRGLIVTVVLDSCHSGGATRVSINGHEETIRTRGQEGNDIDRFPGEVAIFGDAFSESWEANGTSADDRVRQAWLLEPTSFEFFAACRPHEVAYEVTVHGKIHGVLTYAFMEALVHSGGEVTHAMLHRKVHDDVQLLRPRGKRLKGQEPTLAGNGQRYLFSTELADLPATHGVPVTRVASYDASTVRLRAGKAHGVRLGEIYAVFSWNELDLRRLESALAFITITSVGALISKARIIEKEIPDWPSGSQAILVCGSSKASKHFQMGYRHCFQSAIDLHAAVLDRIESIDWERHRYRTIPLIYDKSKTPDFYIAINENSLYELWDSSQTCITMVPASSSIETILDGAVHVSRFNAFLTLQHKFSVSTVQNKVEFCLNGLQSVNGLYTVKNEEAVEIHFNHTSGIPLHFTIFEFSASGSVTRVWPENTDFETVDMNDYRDIPWVVEVPEGLAESVEVYKVFVTINPTSFRMFEMDAPANWKSGESPEMNWSGGLRHDNVEGVKLRSAKGIEEPWYEDKEWEVLDFKVRVCL